MHLYALLQHPQSDAVGDAALGLVSCAGIDASKPAEYIHFARGRDGHHYAVVFGVLGRVVSGVALRRDFQGGGLDPFMLTLDGGIRLLVAETYFPVQVALRGPEFFRIEFHLDCVPWVVGDPEEE